MEWDDETVKVSRGGLSERGYGSCAGSWVDGRCGMKGSGGRERCQEGDKRESGGNDCGSVHDLRTKVIEMSVNGDGQREDGKSVDAVDGQHRARKKGEGKNTKSMAAAEERREETSTRMRKGRGRKQSKGVLKRERAK